MVGDEDAQMMELCGAVRDKAAVLPTTEAGEESFVTKLEQSRDTEAVTGEGWSVWWSQPPGCLGPDPGLTFLLACTDWPLAGKRKRELANGSHLLQRFESLLFDRTAASARDV